MIMPEEILIKLLENLGQFALLAVVIYVLFRQNANNIKNLTDHIKKANENSEKLKEESERTAKILSDAINRLNDIYVKTLTQLQSNEKNMELFLKQIAEKFDLSKLINLLENREYKYDTIPIRKRASAGGAP